MDRGRIADHTYRVTYQEAVQEALQIGQPGLQNIATTPEEAVASVILMDQVPRNIYRGKEAIKARRILSMDISPAHPYRLTEIAIP
jgi:uncharacterized protein (DUF924 family)